MCTVCAIFALTLAGCGSKTKSFQGQIEEITTDKLVVDCTDEVNKGKKGDINAIGYGCSVQLTPVTTYSDEAGNKLAVKDLTDGAMVNITLAKPVNIRSGFESDKPLVLTAQEVVVLSRSPVTSVDQIIAAIEGQGITLSERASRSKSVFERTLQGVEPEVFTIPDEGELYIFAFSSEQEQLEGWSEFLDQTATADMVAYKNYNIDSFLILFAYKNLETDADRKIQHAIDELSEW
ncbi:hypothetical protein DNH61_15150 [Paenibacillus sambharensis]|uniref:Uncharacterized protein n=2 Tax=Paenibacillus sambharensis TaxID=1803190 RepID=A0A2W1LU30_9BACL|nr:hypothetical protein DNH61_15150 [Paenibacillus sambharensis]